MPDYSEDYRNWVGPAGWYDIVGASQFAVLTMMGLRETNSVLDIGCGSIRLGRFLIVYLESDKYHGIEPNKVILEKGIEANIGHELCKMKSPSFNHNDQFDLTVFDRKFEYMIAQSIFTHASQAQILKCLRSAVEVLEDNGLFLFNYGKSDTEDYTGEEWVYPGCTFYRRPTIEGLIREAGLEFEHKSFKPLQQKLDWTIVAKNRAAFDAIQHIPSQY